MTSSLEIPSWNLAMEDGNDTASYPQNGTELHPGG
jgi:hypothetical protein